MTEVTAVTAWLLARKAFAVVLFARHVFSGRRAAAIVLIALVASASLAQESAAPVSAPSGLVGADVGQYGALVYEYPLEVPPGRAGVAPVLHARYSSLANDQTILGRGWSLPIQRIVRDTKFGLHYGAHEYVYFDEHGTETPLVSCASAVCSGTTDPLRFRAKSDDTEEMRFVLDASAQTWIIHHKSGARQVLGGGVQSRMKGSGGIYEWRLDHTQDANGNTISVSYSSEAGYYGYLYPKEIAYTGHAGPDGSVTLAPTRRIRFDYEASAGTVSYRSGTGVWVRFRLKSVRMLTVRANSEQEIGSYAFIYNDDGQLWKIQRRAPGGSADLPPVEFGYAPAVALTRANADMGGALTGGQALPGDFDGDGVDDIAYAQQGWTSWKVMHGAGTHELVDLSTSPYQSRQPKTVHSSYDEWDHLVTGDFDGDGRTDIARARNDKKEWIVALSRGTRFETSEWSTAPWGAIDRQEYNDWNNARFYPDIYWVAGDFNGDGKADIAVSRSGSYAWRVSLSTGNGFSSTTEWYGSPSQMALVNHADGEEAVRFGDFDGDGRTDIVAVRAPSNQWRAYLSRDGYFETALWAGPWVEHLPKAAADVPVFVFVGDFNGDGLSDVRAVSCPSSSVTRKVNCSWQEALSTGSGFAPVREWVTYHTGLNAGWRMDAFLSGDFNGDGRSDVAFTGIGTQTQWYFDLNGPRTEEIGNCVPGICFESCCSAWIPNADALVQTGRFTGTGASIALEAAGSSTIEFISISGSEPPGRLVSVKNGNGAEVRFSYAPSSSFKHRLLPFSVPVVVSARATDEGTGWSATTTWEYGGGYYDAAAREFRGFGWVRRTNPDRTIVETEYCVVADGVDCPAGAEGRPHRISQKSATGVNIGVRKLHWDPRSTAAAPFVRLEHETVTLDGAQEFSTRSLAYDVWGNLETETLTGAGAEAIVRTSKYESFGEWGFRRKSDLLTGATTGEARRTTYDYYDNSPNVRLAVAWIDGVPGPTYSFTYTAQGNVESIEDARHNPRTWFYYDDDDKAHPTGVQFPEANGVPHALKFAPDERFGGAACVLWEDGNTFCRERDAFGRPSSYAGYRGDTSGRSSESALHDVVFLVTVAYSDQTDRSVLPRYVQSGVLEKVARDAAPSVRLNYAYFDGFGRPVHGAWAGEAGKLVVTNTGYDPSGREESSVGPFYSDGTWTPAAPHAWTSSTYDDHGRVVDVVRPGPDGSRAAARHNDYVVSTDGLTVTVTDADGRVRVERRDHLGRVIAVGERMGTAGTRWTRYSYSAAGDLLSVTDAAGNERVFTYDTAGRLRTLQDPDLGPGPGARRGLWEYGWDANGNLETVTDAKGTVIVQAHDALNRLVSRTVQGASAPLARYFYDDPSIPNGIGRLTRIETPDETVTIDRYSPAGNAVSVTRTIVGAPRSYTTIANIDPSGLVTGIRYPDGYEVTYNYRPGTGLLDSVAAAGGAPLATYSSYDALGRPGNVAYGNGLIATYSYNAYTGAPSELLLWGLSQTLSAANAIHYVGTALTNEGDVRLRSDYRRAAALGLPTDGFQFVLGYDDAHRLASELVPAGASSATPSFTAAPPAPKTGPVHGLGVVDTPNGTVRFAYDENGNTQAGWDVLNATSATLMQYSYDADDRLVGVAGPIGQQFVALGYGDGEHRVRKASGRGVRYYVGESFEVAPGGEEIRYVWAHGAILAQSSGDALHFLHQDWTGSTVVVTGADGTVAWRGEYSPFGTIREETGSRVTNRLFAGKEFDDETGLYDFGGRLYDPRVGRFLTPDSTIPRIFDPQSWNRYAFARNSPLSRTDPTGHEDFLNSLWAWTFGNTSDAYYSNSNAVPEGSSHASMGPGGPPVQPEIFRGYSGSDFAPYGTAGLVGTSRWQMAWEYNTEGSVVAPRWGDRVVHRGETWTFGTDRGRDLRFITDVTMSPVMDMVTMIGATGRGGRAPVRLGRFGELRVRAAVDIGKKAKILINGRGRIPDGLRPGTLAEVKNCGSLSFTRQLRDFADYARSKGLRFELWVRDGVEYSGTLAEEIAKGNIFPRIIP